MNGADWSKRYPLIGHYAARIEGSAIFDAEAVWIGSDGVANFEINDILGEIVKEVEARHDAELTVQR